MHDDKLEGYLDSILRYIFEMYIIHMEFTRISHGGNSKYQLLHQQESFKQIAKSIAKSVNDEDPIMFTQLLAHVLQYLQLMHCFVIPVNFILNQILHQKILLKHLVLGIIMN